MLHTVLITLHAVAGVVAFVAGCVALRNGTLFATYLWSLVATILLVALAVAEEWGSLDGAARVLFVAFVALGGLMVWRAARARRTRPAPGQGPPSDRYLDHVGFTLVALFDAFLVVAVLNLGAPGWLVATTGVGIAVAGHFVLRAVKAGYALSATSTRL
jgi:hypothetical protein